MTIRKQRRSGFTIIELLVSMALIMTIMAILSAAFVAGLDTFGKLRATADMAQKLRLAASTLRRDLKADHFDAALRPSDPGFGSTVVPREGFIRIYQGGPPLSEGSCDGINSLLATNHVLQLGVKLRGNRPEDFFYANVPGLVTLDQANNPQSSTTFFGQPADARYQTGLYACQWAEVMYYLVPIGTSTSPTGGYPPQPLYALYRVQRLAVANSMNLAGQTDPNNQMSTRAGPIFNTPADWTTVANRALNPTAPPPGTTDNLILSNVMSFTVRPMARLAPAKNVAAPAYVVPAPMDMQWDSAQPPLDPNSGLPFQLYGVEISIRIWDLKAQQARQITIIQDL
jgi:type II secretory pathway pseudopilin PulG